MLSDRQFIKCAKCGFDIGEGEICLVCSSRALKAKLAAEAHLMSALAKAMMGSAGLLWSTGGNGAPSIKIIFSDVDHLNQFIDAMQPIIAEAKRLSAHPQPSH